LTRSHKRQRVDGRLREITKDEEEGHTKDIQTNEEEEEMKHGGRTEEDKRRRWCHRTVVMVERTEEEEEMKSELKHKTKPTNPNQPNNQTTENSLAWRH
jgi:hypothetical protein